MKKEIGDNNELSKDIDLLISQSKRCSEILKRISKKQIEEDKFFSSTKLENLLEEIINSFKETTSKEIILVSDNDKNKIDIQWSAEMIYGLRNFIGNAIKFSKSKVNIFLISNDKEIKICIRLNVFSDIKWEKTFKEIFINSKKKDDLADSYLMTKYFIMKKQKKIMIM